MSIFPVTAPSAISTGRTWTSRKLPRPIRRKHKCSRFTGAFPLYWSLATLRKITIGLIKQAHFRLEDTCVPRKYQGLTRQERKEFVVRVQKSIEEIPTQESNAAVKVAPRSFIYLSIKYAAERCIAAVLL